MSDSANSIYQKMISSDWQQIISASQDVLYNLFNHDIMLELYPHVDEMNKKTKNINLSGLLFPNRDKFDLAMEIINFHHGGKECPCYFYTNSSYPFFDPDKEEERNHVTVMDTTVHKEEYYTSYTVQCKSCETMFSVTDGEYHFKWWKWENV